jgi:hypothetical protein
MGFFVVFFICSVILGLFASWGKSTTHEIGYSDLSVIHTLLCRITQLRNNSNEFCESRNVRYNMSAFSDFFTTPVSESVPSKARRKHWAKQCKEWKEEE